MSGSTGAEALQWASVLQNVQTQSEGNSPSKLTPFQEKLLGIVKGSFDGNGAEAGLSEALQKIDLLHQATPASPEKETLAALVDFLQKANTDDLVHPENRSAWLAKLFQPQASPVKLDSSYTTVKQGENPFAAKPITSMTGAKMGMKDHKDSGSSSQGKENPTESPFWKRIKRLLGV